MEAGAVSPFPPGLRHQLRHRVTASKLAPIAALLGTADPAYAPRAAATLMTRLLVTRFPGPGTRLLREDSAIRAAWSMATCLTSL
jgi:hypothetical protein